MPQISILTISGEHGAGKSTVSRMLAFRLGWNRISAGDLLREWSKTPEHNPEKIPFQAWYEQLGTSYDIKIDEEIKETLRKKDNMIAESLLGFQQVPHGKPCLKVFLTINPEVAAQRILDHKTQNARSEEKPYLNTEEALADIEKRKQTEIERYEKLYHLNPYDLKYYDLVIDTTYQSPEEIVEQILNAANMSPGTSAYADL